MIHSHAMPSPSTARRAPRISPPESETERQAERIADDVVAGRLRSGQPLGGGSGPGAGQVIHRKCASCAAGGPPCAACAAEEEEMLHLSSVPGPSAGHGSGGSPAGAARAAEAVASGGAPMSEGLRSYFEPRLGADLSGVRLHRDEPAARGINARAYTLGRDIAFAPGNFAPDSREGQRLIAHELAHVLLGDGVIHREEEDETPVEGEAEVIQAPSAPTTRTDTFEDSSGGGSTRFVETVDTAPSVAGDHIQGTVRRREIAPASDTDPEEDVAGAYNAPAGIEAFVDFNASSCEITIPFRFGFRFEANDPRGNSCQGTPVDRADVDVDQIARDYIDAVNAAMNDQFVIHLSDCPHDCAGRDIPIRIRASRDDIDPDKQISVVPRGGRGDAATLCVGSVDEGFPVHEAGHQILGRGDEYPERDASVLASRPEWGRPERVRRDFNVMGSHSSFGRFAVFHERDFRHVQTFMRAAMPDCDAELRSVGDVILDFRLYLLGGGGSLGGHGALMAGGGFDIGVPLTRGREASLILGAQANYLGQVLPYQRELVLVGLRAGLEYQVHGDVVSGRFYGGARAGVSRELSSDQYPEGRLGGVEHFDARTSAFGEAQAGIGLTTHLGSGGLTADLVLGAGGELSSHPDALYWLDVGLMLGARF